MADFGATLLLANFNVRNLMIIFTRSLGFELNLGGPESVSMAMLIPGLSLPCTVPSF